MADKKLASLEALLKAVGAANIATLTPRTSGFPARVFRGQPVNQPLLPSFARRAAKAHLTDPLATERRLLDDFRRLALPHIASPRPQDMFEWMAVGQHHGVPTRLLDWTGNPLFALWFTVREEPQTDAGAFWMLHMEPEHLLPLDDVQQDVFQLKRTYLFRPAHVTARIAAQDGWFTAHWYIEHKSRFIPLEHQPRFENHLRKYVVPASAFKRLRICLGRLGISDSVLFPDLPNLSKDLVERVFSQAEKHT